MSFTVKNRYAATSTPTGSSTRRDPRCDLFTFDFGRKSKSKLMASVNSESKPGFDDDTAGGIESHNQTKNKRKLGDAVGKNKAKLGDDVGENKHKIADCFVKINRVQMEIGPKDNSFNRTGSTSPSPPKKSKSSNNSKDIPPSPPKPKRGRGRPRKNRNTSGKNKKASDAANVVEPETRVRSRSSGSEDTVLLKRVSGTRVPKIEPRLSESSIADTSIGSNISMRPRRTPKPLYTFDEKKTFFPVVKPEPVTTSIFQSRNQHDDMSKHEERNQIDDVGGKDDTILVAPVSPISSSRKKKQIPELCVSSESDNDCSDGSGSPRKVSPSKADSTIERRQKEYMKLRNSSLTENRTTEMANVSKNKHVFPVEPKPETTSIVKRRNRRDIRDDKPKHEASSQIDDDVGSKDDTVLVASLVSPISSSVQSPVKRKKRNPVLRISSDSEMDCSDGGSSPNKVSPSKVDVAIEPMALTKLRNSSLTENRATEMKKVPKNKSVLPVEPKPGTTSNFKQRNQRDITDDKPKEEASNQIDDNVEGLDDTVLLAPLASVQSPVQQKKQIPVLGVSSDSNINSSDVDDSPSKVSLSTVDLIIEGKQKEYMNLRNSSLTGNRVTVMSEVAKNVASFCSPELCAAREIMECEGVFIYEFHTSDTMSLGYYRIQGNTLRPPDTLGDCSILLWVISGNPTIKSCGGFHTIDGVNVLYGQKVQPGACVCIPPKTCFTIENWGLTDVLLGFCSTKDTNILKTSKK